MPIWCFLKPREEKAPLKQHSHLDIIIQLEQSFTQSEFCQRVKNLNQLVNAATLSADIAQIGKII